jgi:hypothetical protein
LSGVDVDTRLDKDYWPIWLVKCAGYLFPVLMLASSVVAILVHHQRGMFDGFLLVWCTILILLFFSRYRAHKFGSLVLEFYYGFVFILIPVFLKIAIDEVARFKWITLPFFGAAFVWNAIRYVKRF